MNNSRDSVIQRQCGAAWMQHRLAPPYTAQYTKSRHATQNHKTTCKENNLYHTGGKRRRRRRRRKEKKLDTKRYIHKLNRYISVCAYNILYYGIVNICQLPI